MNGSKRFRDVTGSCRGVFRALHHGLAAVGLIALMLFLLQAGASFVSGHSADLARLSDGPVRQEPPAPEPQPAADNSHRALATYLSKRYRVAQIATEQLVGVAFQVGQQVGLDPLLILAVMAVESRLNPFAESEFGAKGLMQVIPKYHQDKLNALGGEHAVLDPMINVLLGARILKDYIRLTGNLEAGLQFYNGALSDPSSEYAQKVIAEQERMKQAIHRLRAAPGASAV